MYYITNTKCLSDKNVARLGKTWAIIPLKCQNQIVSIFQKWVLKQVIKMIERKSEIMTIPNKYRYTLNDHIDSLNIESPNELHFLHWLDFPYWLGLINNKLCNVPRSRNNSWTILKEDSMDKNVPVMLLESAPKIWDL